MRIQDLVEYKIGEANFGDIHVIYDSHAMDRTIERFVSPNEIDRTLKKIPQVSEEIKKIDKFVRFYIVDTTQEISLGFRRLKGNSIFFKTVVDSANPYGKDIDIILKVS